MTAETKEVKEEVKVEEETPVEQPANDAAPADAPEVKEEVADEEMPPVKEEDVEKDEPADCKDARHGNVRLSTGNSTVNCVLSEGGLVSAVCMDHVALLAATRLNVGITKGRYLFEVEVLQAMQQSEVRIGFSLENSSLFLGDKNTIGFSTFSGQFLTDGALQKGFTPRRCLKGDIIGILLNRSEEGNANTLSLFVNGKRIGEPVKIPESFDGALYPHVTVRANAIVSVNLTKTVRKPLPFTCRTIGDVSVNDCVESNSTINEEEHGEVIVPLGFHNEEWIEQYKLDHPKDNYVVLSQAFMNEWIEKSNLKRQPLSEDAQRAFFKIMALRKRKFIYCLGHNLLSEDRTKFCDRFTKAVKKTVIFADCAIEKLPANLSFYEKVTLPTKEEGWDAVEFTKNEAKAQEGLEQWKKKCKNQTKVEDFKATDKLKEKIIEWTKFRAATEKKAAKDKKERDLAIKLASGEAVPEEKEEEEKKDEKKEGEEKEPEATPSSVDTQFFTPEDWMLAELRMQLHTLCHAFKEDVEDKERIGFSLDYLSHYFRLYAPPGVTFHQSTFGCKGAGEVIELIKDSFKVQDHLLMAVHGKGEEFDTFVNLCEEARVERENLIGAGDEGAKLKFKARVIPQHVKRAPQGAKGGGGAKGPLANKGGRPAPAPAQQGGFKGGHLAAKGAGKGPFGGKAGQPSTYTMARIPGALPSAAGGIKRPLAGGAQPLQKRFAN